MMMTMMMMMLTTKMTMLMMMMMITITGDPVRLGANITLTRAHAKNNLQGSGPTSELVLGPELNNISKQQNIIFEPHWLVGETFSVSSSDRLRW